MLLEVFRKKETLQRLNMCLEHFKFLYTEETTDTNFLRLANCHREIMLIQDLPDDENFWKERLRLLEVNNLLCYSDFSYNFVTTETSI